ncbi:hypothetical protein [Martelella sp.]|uniref:hypothetical protein n=1 Tax=Martelella sp. TaxID=1969699 RepID=UPI0032427069
MIFIVVFPLFFSGRRRRRYRDASLFEPRPDRVGESIRIRCIGMEADALRLQRAGLSASDRDTVIADDRNHLIGSLMRIGDQSLRIAAWQDPSIGAIATVGIGLDV